MIKEITISTPFYNEEEGLENFFDTILKINNFKSKLSVKIQYLFINDGSSDNTLQILENFKLKNSNIDIKIISHDQNYGYGRTIKTSFENSETKYLIMYDSDCTYDFNLIENLIEVVNKNENLDMVNVSYKLASKENRSSIFRSSLTIMASFIYRLFFKEIKENDVGVYTCSFRIYNLEKFKDIKISSDDFNACAEIMIRAILKKLIIKEIAGKNQGRKYGRSKMKILKNVFNSLKTIFVIKFNL